MGDFITRVNELYPLEIDNDELNALLTTIKNQGDELEVKDKEIDKLKNLIGRLEKEAQAREEGAPTAAAAAETPAPAPEAPTAPAETPAPKAEKAPAAAHTPKKKGGKHGGKR